LEEDLHATKGPRGAGPVKSDLHPALPAATTLRQTKRAKRYKPAAANFAV
jgi:hypothetical protein